MKILKILLIFTVSFISGGVDYGDVTGYTGGSVLINCKYTNPNSVNHTKYFCKLDEKNQCMEKFLSNESTTPNPDQKIFFMHEKLGLYNVLIKNISLQDAGTYRCGVENKNQFTDVELKVEEDTCCGKSFPHKAHPGETVTFTCKYPAEFQQYNKYLYNVTNHNLSTVIFTFGSSVQKGRFSISDHKNKKLFNVSISNLTVEDAGVYLCGAQKIYTKPYFSLFNEMQLQVEPKTPGHSIPLSSGSLAVVIAVSVCVILLVIGGVGGGALIFYKRRQTKTRDSAPASSTRRNSVNSEEAHQGPYYEEIPDNQPSSSTVYATAENPRAPSNTERAANRSTEPPAEFYSMAQLSNPASGVSAVYATVDDCT
ncbi:hypothetical protein AMEX_G24690 [Astyanax mexicanus]|uniref:Immunoglobulin domain-containing protein n=1 Tax=Astyanax mexicanus TaxID=7994 RepID=A0A8T2L0H6_ASTMX|nr:hypothetical protein AMEX_G24690 [Astyanax mexicanus]